LRSIEKEIKNQEKQSLSTAITFAQKGDKKEALFWLERALKSNIVNLKMIKDLESKSFSKYKKDLDYILLIQKYLGYSVVVDGKQYKVGGDIFTGGKERVFVFVDGKGTVVRDLALAKEIAQAAWVYENVVKAPGLPGSKRVSAILETHKRLRQYEFAQGILARASVQVLAATISGGATLTYTVPVGLTWRVVREQFLNLKGLLSLTGRQGLEEALSKYQQIESSVANLKPNSIDEVTAVEIRRLYEPAHGLELSCGALLTSLMPKKGRQLLEKALKDIGDELVRTLPLSDEVLTTQSMLDLQKKMDDALKSNPALKEYYEKLEMAERLKEANEQVITAWAEQAVGYKE
jgi:tetratricopeptide (TPR) repeat protein